MGTRGNIHVLLAVTMASAFALSTPAPPPVASDDVWVTVAARDLHPGVPITEDDLMAIAVPLSLVPDGVFLDPAQVVGQRAHERVLVNEMVRAERLADVRSGRGLNAWIPMGMRAVTVDFVDENVSALHRPGDFIDVKITLPNGETHMLLQSVLPLGFMKSGDPEVSYVTLLVTSENAEQIAYANEMGLLKLGSRGIDCGWYYEPPEGITLLREALGWTGEP